MAELSDFLPKSGGAQYVEDYFSGSSITYTETTVTTTTHNIVNVSGKGVAYINTQSTSASITLRVDGYTFTATRLQMQRTFGTDTSQGFSVPFKTSIAVDATSSGSQVTVGVAT